MQDMFIRAVSAALLSALLSWLLVLFPFGVVGLRDSPYVRISAGFVLIIVFIMALFLVEM